MLKKNILVVVEHFGQGGAERVASMVAQMLYETSRYNVWLYAVHATSKIPDFKGIVTGTFEARQVNGTVAKALVYYKKIQALKKFKKQQKIDITISSLWPVDWINAITGTERKIAICQINILNNPQNEKMVKYHRIVSLIYKRFDKIVLGGSNLANELSEHFKIDSKKLKVIHNPIDTLLIEQNILKPLSQSFEELFKSYNVCVAAHRFVPTKNTEALVLIYKAIQLPNVKFLLIGEGQERESIQKLITDERLSWSQLENPDFNEEANFYFLDFQSNIHNIISKAVLFMFPTKAEGLPLALLEAMYCGVPIIVSDCPNGGVAETVDAKIPYDGKRPRTAPEKLPGGYLMPVPESDFPSTITSWSEKMKEIISADNKKRKLIKEANQNRAKQFDKNSIQAKWIEVLNEVVENENKK